MRPKKSYFTRVQRLTCALALLLLMMVTNAMWFEDPSASINNSATGTNEDDSTENKVSCYFTDDIFCNIFTCEINSYCKSSSGIMLFIPFQCSLCLLNRFANQLELESLLLL